MNLGIAAATTLGSQALAGDKTMMAIIAGANAIAAVAVCLERVFAARRARAVPSHRRRPKNAPTRQSGKGPIGRK